MIRRRRGWLRVHTSRFQPPSSDRSPAIVLEVVSEKTGYPAEVLDLDMQLDADLGIDSIKRVEILSAFKTGCRRFRRSHPSCWVRFAPFDRSSSTSMALESR